MMSNQVTCEQTKEQVIFMLNNYWNCNYTGFTFPLPNYPYLERKNLDTIKNGDYVFTIKKVNHKRAIFMLYKNHKDENKQFLIFRDNTIIETNLKIENSYYRGSIFDVMYDESGKICIYDTFMAGGYRVNYCDYKERHDYAETVSKNSDELSFCKTYNEIKNISENEELYFINNVKCLVSGQDTSSFRWRPSELLNICLKVKENEKNLDLYTTNFKLDKLFASITDENVIKIKSLQNYTDGCIVNFNIKKVEFNFINVETEQKYPTSIKQIENIILIKHENITFLELSG